METDDGLAAAPSGKWHHAPATPPHPMDQTTPRHCTSHRVWLTQSCQCARQIYFQQSTATSPQTLQTESLKNGLSKRLGLSSSDILLLLHHLLLRLRGPLFIWPLYSCLWPLLPGCGKPRPPLHHPVRGGFRPEGESYSAGSPGHRGRPLALHAKTGCRRHTDPTPALAATSREYSKHLSLGGKFSDTARRSKPPLLKLDYNAK